MLLGGLTGGLLRPLPSPLLRPLQTRGRASLARMLRLRLYREGVAAGRRKWRMSRPRRLALASAVGAAGLALGGLAVQDSTIGPIYQWEENGEEAQLPLDYNVPAMDRFFVARPGEVTRRTGQIMTELLPYCCRLFIWEYLIRGKIREHEGLQRKYAVQLRELLTRLGPCFIKFGQAVSIRPDLLPSSFLFELQKLCDAVPSFPTSEALAVMQSELGVETVASVFPGLESDTQPVAAASLGQVYCVRLEGREGRFAVKVQRPDMHRAVLRDLFILRRLARATEWLKSTLTRQRPFDVSLLDTFAGATMQELDYLNEADNQERAKTELETRLKGRVVVPAVVRELTSRRVLTTEWVEGEQLAKSPASTINRLIPIGVECFLVQLLEIGFFHADPHPGNILVTPEGKLALIDFGLMAGVPIPATRTMTKTVVHLMQGDVVGLVEDAVELGFLPDDVDRASLTPVLQRVFDSAQLAVTDQVRAGLTYKAIQGRRKQFWAVSADLNRIFYLYPFLVPDYFALITRAMIVLEGIAITGDKEFDLFRAAYPYCSRRAVQLFGYSGVLSIAREASSKMKEMGLEAPPELTNI